MSALFGDTNFCVVIVLAFNDAFWVKKIAKNTLKQGIDPLLLAAVNGIPLRHQGG